MGLADYKDIIGIAASTASFCLLLSPSVICYQIWQKGSTKDIPFSPFIEGTARSSLILQQGIVMGIYPVIVTHSIGLLLNLSYITVYLSFTKDKSEAKKSMLQWAAFLVPMISYANYEDKALVEGRFGTLVTIFSVSIVLFHLYRVRHVIQTKNTKDLPFPILVSVFFVTFLWTLYGYAINKPALQMQTGFSFCVCVLQLSLFAIYPSKPSDEKKTD